MLFGINCFPRNKQNPPRAMGKTLSRTSHLLSLTDLKHQNKNFQTSRKKIIMSPVKFLRDHLIK